MNRIRAKFTVLTCFPEEGKILIETNNYPCKILINKKQKTGTLLIELNRLYIYDVLIGFISFYNEKVHIMPARHRYRDFSSDH